MIIPVEKLLGMYKDTAPEPLQTAVVTLAAGRIWAVIRRWRRQDAARCRLCDRCSFTAGDDGQGVCIVASRLPVTPEEAPRFGVRTPVVR
jgi:hypothetical protein